MRLGALFIEGQRLDLFEDVEVKLNASVQNVSDIQKVFTEYTQSFSVPATPNNNQIFQHFYNYDIDGTVDHQLRRDGYIEINSLTFKVGRVQLEKAEIKNARIESYTVTFYGAVRSFQDLLGDGKLSDLDLSATTHDYNYTEVRNRIINSNQDIRYPLISSSRVWQYNNTSTPTENIDTTGGAINFRELFPAIRVKKIIEAIETDYAIDFQGLFFDSDNFKNLYLWAKNNDTLLVLSAPQTVNITTFITSNAGNYFNITNDTVSYQYTTQVGSNVVTSGTHNVRITISSVSDVNVPYYIDVYENGVLLNTVTGTGNNNYALRQDNNVSGLSRVLNFKIRTSGALTYTPVLTYSFEYGAITSGGATSLTVVAMTNCATNVHTASIDIATLLPDMLITDFLVGIFKQFNLTCYGLNQSTFIVEPLEDFYNRGNIFDITPYTDIETIGVERLKLYRKIDFKFKESKSFMNEQYKQLYKKGFGDLSYSFQYDGGDYPIELPFEQLLFNNMDGAFLQAGYALTPAPDFKPYAPAPILLYTYDSKACTFYLTDGTTPSLVTSYIPMGQDTRISQMDYSTNFGDEVSSLLLMDINNTAYQTYYAPYLQNLYNKKNRLTRVKTRLPLSLLLRLKLNDRLIIRYHRFIINDMVVNLSTGQVDFSLVNDFRRLRQRVPIKIPSTGGIVKVPFTVLNETKSVIVDAGMSGITASPSTWTTDTEVEFTVPSTTVGIRSNESGDRRITESGDVRIVEKPSDSSMILTVDVITELLNGDTETETIEFIMYG